MENNKLLTGAVMLETMWAIKNKDLLDLISPFVFYVVARKYSINEIIDKRTVLNEVISEFGYSDMPQSIIEKVFRRNPHLFKKVKADYALNQSLDSIVSDFESRRDDCEKKIEIICNQLYEYFDKNRTGKKKYTKEDVIKSFQDFFSRQGLFLGTNQLEEHSSGLDDYETDYLIAQYLFEKRDSKAIEYDYAIDLVKGFFLQTAIYLQTDNSIPNNTTYKNVSFYYDTPFILRMLGYKSDEDKDNTQSLHNLLKQQKGSFYYFPHTKKEINGILIAYKNNIGHFSVKTLEGLDKQNYTSYDVDRLLDTWETRLLTEFSVKQIDAPNYPQKKDGTIDEQYVIDEKELYSILKSKIDYHDIDSIDPDLKSAICIHILRKTASKKDESNCNAVFVTTNTKLARVINNYYWANVSKESFPLVISDCDLAALTWIKCGSKDNTIPERQLLRNAYMSTQPAPEILEKFSFTLDKMQKEGRVSESLAIAIRSSRYAKKELLFASFDGNEEINENVVSTIEQKLRDEFSIEARIDERNKAERERKKDYHDRLENVEKEARLFAQRKKNRVLKIGRISCSIVLSILIAFSVVGLVFSIKESLKGNIWKEIALFAFIIASVFSIVDTLKGRGRFVDYCLVLLANKYYKNLYKDKLEEYKRLFPSDYKEEIERE